MNVCATELDWVTLHDTPTPRRHLLFNPPNPVDLVLVVDCIYHPSLLPALIETIDYLAKPVLVVAELRSHEVIEEFLRLWLCRESWKICRLGKENCLGRPYVAWLGFKALEGIGNQ